MTWWYLLIGLSSNTGTALVVIPQTYSIEQCQQAVKEYTWPWSAKCVPSPQAVDSVCDVTTPDGNYCRPKKLGKSWVAP